MAATQLARCPLGVRVTSRVPSAARTPLPSRHLAWRTPSPTCGRPGRPLASRPSALKDCGRQGRRSVFLSLPHTVRSEDSVRASGCERAEAAS